MYVKILKLIKLITNFKLLKIYLFNNVVPSFEHEKVLIEYSGFNTIIDIGSNKGQFSSLAQNINKLSKIISFEPLSEPAMIFEKLFKSNDNVKLFRAGIGPKEKEYQMHVSKKMDSSSILPIGKNQSTIFKGTGVSHKEKIFVAPLNYFINNNDLINPVFVKIDVQGYELEVLKGSKSLIDEFDYIYVECSFVELYEGQALADEVIAYLANYSFRLKGVYNTFYDKKGIAVQGDFLFAQVKE